MTSKIFRSALLAIGSTALVLTAVPAAYAFVTDGQAIQAFEAMDQTNDGLVSDLEWANWQGVTPHSNESRFGVYDLNHNGVIDLNEYMNAVRQQF